MEQGKSRYRSWCLTYWGDEAPDLSYAKYWCRQQEIAPSTGKKHWQCYVYTENQRTVTAMRKKYKGHNVVPAFGTPDQNKAYCSKSETSVPGTFEEYGELPKQGKRNDLQEVKELQDSGVSVMDIAKSHYNISARHHRFFEKYESYQLQFKHQGFKKVEVLVLIGKPGVGKTRWAYEQDPHLYAISENDCKWFDGYTGQKTVLLDDYYGECPYAKFLKLTDGYSQRLPIKGGFTWKCWDRMIITSNHHPDKWYLDVEALMRRIKVVEMEVGASITPTSES